MDVWMYGMCVDEFAMNKGRLTVVRLSGVTRSGSSPLALAISACTAALEGTARFISRMNPDVNRCFKCCGDPRQRMRPPTMIHSRLASASHSSMLVGV